MTSAERVLRLAGHLYDRRVITPAELDAVSGLTMRTRKRDVDLLRRCGWRITWDAECGIYRVRSPKVRMLSNLITACPHCGRKIEPRR